MRKINFTKRYSTYNLCVLFLFVILELTYGFDEIEGYSLKVFDISRSYLIITIFLIWTYSLYKRIIHRNIRNLSVLIGILLIFWMIIRSIKFYFVTEEIVIHYLWYCYYIPLCFIPVLWLYIAMMVGNNPISYKDHKILLLPFLISGALCLLVLCNDTHHLVFQFNTINRAFDDEHYRYGIGYYGVVGWDLFCTVCAFVILFSKCRNKKNNKMIYLPILTTLPTILYVVFYALGFKFFTGILTDITRSFCVSFMMIIESSVVSGLISNNVFYKELFSNMGIPLFIVDDQYHLYVSSSDHPHHNLKDLKEAYLHPVLIQNEFILSAHKIKGGIAYYQNDVKEYIAINERLKKINEELKDRFEVTKRRVQVEKKKEELFQENKLYLKLQSQNRFRLQRMKDLIEEIEKGNDQRDILLELSILGVYFKRRNNFLFMSLDEKNHHGSELEYCLKESFELLNKFDIEASYSLPQEDTISIEESIQIYDSLEVILEKYFQDIESIVLLIKKEKIVYIVLTFRTCVLLELEERFRIDQEGNKEYVVSFSYDGGRKR